jgi:hypothetical protein
MEFAKYPKSLFQMPTKGRGSVTALSQNVAPATIQVWSVCTQRRHMDRNEVNFVVRLTDEEYHRYEVHKI